MPTADAYSIDVEPENSGTRLDRHLAEQGTDRGWNLSRTRIKALICDGFVRVNGVVLTDPAQRLVPGTNVVLNLPPLVAANPESEALPLFVVYEDDHLIVVDKPAGLVVHPAAGHASGTLVNALVAHCGSSLSGIGGVARPGIVHRLDKDTTGLIVAAKSDAAHHGLAALFADHGRSGSLVREYQALIWGIPEQKSGFVDAPLARAQRNREKIAVTRGSNGRHAITHWRITERYGETACALMCRLETGRTHQIRVHMAHVGHPVMGDRVYGAAFKTKAALLSSDARAALTRLDRQALHAAVLGFEHPVTGEPLMFNSPPPAELSALTAALRSMN